MENQTKEAQWMCDKCHEALVVEKVRVRYLEGSFEVELYLIVFPYFQLV